MTRGKRPILHREELRLRILKTAMRAFFAKGIKAVKMDDIAQALAISKRTLYETYNNKEELLLEGLKYLEDLSDMHMIHYSQDPRHNVMDILIEFYHMQINHLAIISPLFFAEMEKYKRVVAYLDKKHKERDGKKHDFFERGIREGFFRADINYRIVTEIGRASVEYAMKTQMYKLHTLQDMFRNLIFLFIRGICTQKGLDELEKGTE